MRHTFLVFLMICLAANLAGQNSSTTAQQTYNSPDGAFEFKYPEDLVVKHEPTGANCQGNLVCVEWNSDTYQGSNFGGAGFWVSKPQAGKMSAKTECLKFREYPDEKPSSTVINGRNFAMLERGGAAAGTTTSIRLHRIVHGQECYELGTAISIAGGGYSEDDYAAGRVKRFTRKDYSEVEATLQRIVSSFRFLK